MERGWRLRYNYAMRTYRWMLVVALLGGCTAAGGDADPDGGSTDQASTEGTHESAADGEAAWAPLPEPAPDPSLAPFPFTRQQIRTATPVGRTYRFEMGLGADARFQILLTFVEVNAEGCTMRSVTVGPDGEAAGEPNLSQTTWAKLQQHASFPADETEVIVEAVEVPAGTFACRCYTRTETTEEGVRVERAWFADDLPGAPVRHEVTLDGTVVSTMVLMEHSR